MPRILFHIVFVESCCKTEVHCPHASWRFILGDAHPSVPTGGFGHMFKKSVCENSTCQKSSSELLEPMQCEWLKEKVSGIPVRLCFESSLELMSTTQIGRCATYHTEQ